MASAPYEIPGATQRFVDVGDVTLSVYEAEPDGGADPDRPVVVFSHGFPELAYTWRQQLPAVAAAGFRAIAPDQRGYGGSSRPERQGRSKQACRQRQRFHGKLPPGEHVGNVVPPSPLAD